MKSRLTIYLLSFYLALASLAAAQSPRQSRDYGFGGTPKVIDPETVHLPAKRTYDSHHYYAVETRSNSNVDPRDVAELLGAEFVERVGELQNHWLVRSEKSLTSRQADELKEEGHSSPIASRSSPSDGFDRDPILKRWTYLSQSRHLPSHGLSKRDHVLALSIKNVERQVLRKRHKRNIIYSPWDTPHLDVQNRAPIPGPEPHPYPDPLPRPPMIPTAKHVLMALDYHISDPIFPEQWHLANDRRPQNDLNVSGVWAQNITGTGVRVALIDDGLDMHSPDLKENFFAKGSYDFNAHVALPEPRETDDQHGTRCAGEIAAIKNDVCGVGVAYTAQVSGLRILSGPISDVDEAAALNYAYHDNHIYSCSWGPPDDGRSMDAPKGLIAKAILNGIQNGRSGRGSIYVFAGGNGGAFDDQCNFDGYTNSIYTMTIAATDRENLHPYYSEMCASNIATGWSSGSNDHIHTTDVAWNGINRCTAHHGGTSAAAPLVAAVVALGLQIRPELTWRDVQHITVRSAQMINPDDPDWQKTQAGRHYNHKFGYGVVDAYQFVEETKRHQLVKPQAWLTSPNQTVSPEETFIGEGGVKQTFTITEQMMKDANLETLEHVTVRVWIHHERRGDVNVELTSPHGTKSVLARPRRHDDATTGFPGWGFMTLKHWDESAIGDWTIAVFDRAHPKQTGNFYAWQLTLWGQSIDPKHAKPWNFPEDSLEYHETLASAPSTTLVQGAGASDTTGSDTYTLPKPTDHLPADHGTRPGESHQDFTNGNGSTPEGDTGYLTGLKKNSTWLFIAVGIVLIFGASVAVFFLLRRRRRGGRRGGGDTAGYEFVPDDEDEMQMSRLDGGLAGATSRTPGGGVGGGAGGGNGRRTREIYDAFRAGSDDEDADEDEDEVSLLKSRASQGRGGRNDGRSGVGGAGSSSTRSYRDDPEDDPVDQRGQGRRIFDRDEEEDEDERFTIGGEGEMTPLPSTATVRSGDGGGGGGGKEGNLIGSAEGGDGSRSGGSGGSGGNGGGGGSGGSGDDKDNSSGGSWQDAELDDNEKQQQP